LANRCRPATSMTTTWGGCWIICLMWAPRRSSRPCRFRPCSALNSLKAIKAQAKASEKRRFFCRADAEAAANEILVQETAYHRLKLRVIEHAMRLGLEARNAMLPGWDNKPTRRPSAYMMTWKFKGVIVLCVGQ
jgi:hypothetical protein